MSARREQLRELFHVEFPDELFEFWAWHQALEPAHARTLREVVGVTLHGAFDVLSGAFDGRDLRYPAVLHYRYQFDPPEFFTVLVGNVDGLHWGYWFDDPGRLPPVVASFYARDAFELTQYDSLFTAVSVAITRSEQGTRENRTADRAARAAYDRDLAALSALKARLPATWVKYQRKPTFKTADGMGGVVASELVGSLTEFERREPQSFIEAELAAGRPGTLLKLGKTLWEDDKLLALDVLSRAYAALGREGLQRVAEAHRAHPELPSVDVLSYQPGDYADLSDALAKPGDVRVLRLHQQTTLDDRVGTLTNLVKLELGGNRLTTLPRSLATCTKLEVVNLYNNQLISVPPELFDLPALHTVTLAKNQLATLEGVERCRSLRELDVSHNPLTKLPADLSLLGGLERLVLNGTLVPADELSRLRAALPTTEVLANEAGPAKQYSPKVKFAERDKVNHPTFGLGQVLRVLGDGKIDVEFEHTRKTLVHGRG